MKTNLLSKFLLFSVTCIALTGCQTLEIHQLGYVSKENMLFDRGPTASIDSRLTGQFEPGAAQASSAQAAGCSSCR